LYNNSIEIEDSLNGFRQQGYRNSHTFPEIDHGEESPWGANIFSIVFGFEEGV
jgi:hypothetical protein